MFGEGTQNMAAAKTNCVVSEVVPCVMSQRAEFQNCWCEFVCTRLVMQESQ